jgi:hypothetical protein
VPALAIRSLLLPQAGPSPNRAKRNRTRTHVVGTNIPLLPEPQRQKPNHNRVLQPATGASASQPKNAKSAEGLQEPRRIATSLRSTQPRANLSPILYGGIVTFDQTPCPQSRRCCFSEAIWPLDEGSLLAASSDAICRYVQGARAGGTMSPPIRNPLPCLCATTTTEQLGRSDMSDVRTPAVLDTNRKTLTLCRALSSITVEAQLYL